MKTTEKMKELTIEHLAAYLPYGVNVYGASDIWTVHSAGIEGISIANGLHVQNLSINDCFSDYSLLLRPLSDLTKPITHNGETFVPMVRLAEFIGMDTGKHVVDSEDIEGIFTVGIRCNVDNGLAHGHQYEVLAFDLESGFGKHYRPAKEWDIVPNQLSLWQMIHSWHFDTFNLISDGLAIDINTLTK